MWWIKKTMFSRIIRFEILRVQKRSFKNSNVGYGVQCQRPIALKVHRFNKICMLTYFYHIRDFLHYSKFRVAYLPKYNNKKILF